MSDGRRRQWVAVPVDISSEPVVEALTEEFGWQALAVWVCLHCAAKRSLVEGQVAFTSDADLLNVLGMDATALERCDGTTWTFDEFFAVTGRFKETKRSSRGRRSFVRLTRFGSVQKVRGTRTTDAPDTHNTGAGQREDSAKTAQTDAHYDVDTDANPLVTSGKYEHEGSTDSRERVTRTVTERGEAKPDLFAERFWPAYPRKVGKPKALVAWKNATKRTDPETILAGLMAWVPYWEAKGEPEFIPHPTTWLNRDGWADTPPAPSAPKQGRRGTFTAGLVELAQQLDGNGQKELTSGVA